MRWFKLRNISIVAVAFSAGAALSPANGRGQDIYVTINNSGGNNSTIGEYTTSGAVVNASLVSGLGSPVGLAITNAVPEPSSLALLFSFLAVGTISLLAYGLRRRAKRTAQLSAFDEHDETPNMKYFGCILALGIVLCAGKADSQTLTTLIEFTGTGGTANGQGPIGSLTLSGTTLYGTTSSGGNANGYGNIFSVGTNGANYQNLLSFSGTGGAANGLDPVSSLTLSGTTLYGMTNQGGNAYGWGNLFSDGTNGWNYQNLISFTYTSSTASGRAPVGGLTLSGTTLYGMTSGGGTYGWGNVFSVGTNGTNYQNLVSFTGIGGTENGASPSGSLTLSGTTLYGMTVEGGNEYGNIFSVGTNGTNYQNLVSFTGNGGTASGYGPQGSLTLGGTTLYGMTSSGGTNTGNGQGAGNIFSVGTNGTNYKDLLSFSGSSGPASGLEPWGSLILSGTTLYGMTSQGGTNAYCGNIFSVGIDGSDYEDLYSFSGGRTYPEGALSLSGGTLFGITAWGGNLSLNDGNGDGTVFALSLPVPTPEPSTLVLLAAAAIALLGYAWRRRVTRTAKPAPLDQDAPTLLSFPSHSSSASAARRAA